LHISKEEQKRRFLERLEDPKKNWKFSMADVNERAFWKDYQEACEEMIQNTAMSTLRGSWFLRITSVYATDRGFRNYRGARRTHLSFQTWTRQRRKSWKLSGDPSSPEGLTSESAVKAGLDTRAAAYPLSRLGTRSTTELKYYGNKRANFHVLRRTKLLLRQRLESVALRGPQLVFSNIDIYGDSYGIVMACNSSRHFHSKLW